MKTALGLLAKDLLSGGSLESFFVAPPSVHLVHVVTFCRERRTRWNASSVFWVEHVKHPHRWHSWTSVHVLFGNGSSHNDAMIESSVRARQSVSFDISLINRGGKCRDKKPVGADDGLGRPHLVARRNAYVVIFFCSLWVSFFFCFCHQPPRPVLLGVLFH